MIIDYYSQLWVKLWILTGCVLLLLLKTCSDRPYKIRYSWGSLHNSKKKVKYYQFRVSTIFTVNFLTVKKNSWQWKFPLTVKISSWQWKFPLTVKNINWQWKFAPVIFFTVIWYFLLSVEIFTVSWKFLLSVVVLTVKMWYFLLSNRYWTKYEFNLVAYEDSSESLLQMKFFLDSCHVSKCSKTCFTYLCFKSGPPDFSEELLQ